MNSSIHRYFFAVFVTDLGGASALVTNRIGLTASLSRPKTSITITPLPSKLDVASNQVLMISEAELLMTNKAKVLINLEAYPIHQAGAKRDQLIETVRTQLAKDGCAVLKSFLTPNGVRLLPMHPMVRQMPILPLMIHRLPSITRAGKLVGIVSIGNVVKRLLEKYEQEAELIKQFISS